MIESVLVCNDDFPKAFIFKKISTIISDQLDYKNNRFFRVLKTSLIFAMCSVPYNFVILYVDIFLLSSIYTQMLSVMLFMISLVESLIVISDRVSGDDHLLKAEIFAPAIFALTMVILIN